MDGGVEIIWAMGTILVGNLLEYLIGSCVFIK